MSLLSEYAPAKVNLHLHVVGRRMDGYHLLDSLVVFAGIGDRLVVSPNSDLSLSIAGPFAAELDSESDNLVLRAARALATRAGIEPAGRLVLEKNLPVASGIGGGSADAAAALRLLCRFWKLDPGILTGVGSSLGADVPVCVAGRPMLMSVIGDVLTPVPKLPNLGIMLVNPGVAVSTPAVFRTRSGPFSDAAHVSSHGWAQPADLIAALLTTRNDLEPAARRLVPAIDVVLEAIETAPGCLMARMSGSGATCFGLFQTPAAAMTAARTIVHDGWWVWGGGLATR